MIRTVSLNTGSSPKSSKAGSGINILYLLTGPINAEEKIVGYKTAYNFNYQNQAK